MLFRSRFIIGGREVATIFDGGRIAILKARDGLPLREIKLPGEIRLLPAEQQPLSGDRVLYANVSGEVLLVDLSRSGETRSLGEPCKLAAVNAEAIFCAGTGGVAGPLASEAGFDIVRVTRTETASIDSDATRDAIRGALFEQWLADQRSAARIEWFWGPAD